MSLQKQKRLLSLIRSRLTKNFPAVVLVIVFWMCALCAALYLQPAPPQPASPVTSAAQTHRTHHAAAAAKKPAPAAPKPQPPATPPATVTQTAPPKAAAHTAGTPKPEPTVTPAPGSSVSGLAPTTPPSDPQPPSQQSSSPPVTTGYTSTNWSGYLAANGTFSAVSGSWTATSPTGNGSTTSADSTWIGIGGVTASDLIQIGTQNTVTAAGQVTAAAFYELLPNYSQPVPGVTVAPGDSMTASITEVSGDEWRISITDNTDDETYTATVTYDSSLSSAEWIEEDPSYSFTRQIPFDNFQRAAFAGASTVDNGAAANLASSTAQPVTMVNDDGQTVAAPSAIGSDGASFTVTP